MVRARGVFAILAGATVLVAGCGTPQQHPIARESEQIGTQPVCCASFRDMPFVALHAAQKRTFVIDTDTPVYAFRDGRSRFVAVRLPAAPASLRVRSNVITAWVEPTTFDPFVTFLDGGYQSLGESALPTRVAAESGARFLEGEIRVPRGAAFAVLYTKPAVYLTKRREGPPPLVVGAQSMSIPMTSFVVAGPRGELVLEATGRD